MDYISLFHISNSIFSENRVLTQTLPIGQKNGKKSIHSYKEHDQNGKIQTKLANWLDDEATETGRDEFGTGEHNAKTKKNLKI